MYILENGLASEGRIRGGLQDSKVHDKTVDRKKEDGRPNSLL